MKRQEDEILRDHIKKVRDLITRIEKKSRDDIEIANLDRLRKRINLLLNTFGTHALVVEMSPMMIEYSEPILERKETFFMDMNAREEYFRVNGRNPSAEDEFMFQLIESVRGHYRKSLQAEKDAVYKDVLDVFTLCMEHRDSYPNRYPTK